MTTNARVLEGGVWEENEDQIRSVCRNRVEFPVLVEVTGMHCLALPKPMVAALTPLPEDRGRGLARGSWTPALPPARGERRKGGGDFLAQLFGVPMRNRLPSESRSSISLAHGASSTLTPNSAAMESTSPRRRYTSVSGRASPLCSDRKIRTLPRAIVTKAGKPGSKRCTDSCLKPMRLYHATALSASSTRRIGMN